MTVACATGIMGARDKRVCMNSSEFSRDWIAAPGRQPGGEGARPVDVKLHTASYAGLLKPQTDEAKRSGLSEIAANSAILAGVVGFTVLSSRYPALAKPVGRGGRDFEVAGLLEKGLGGAGRSEVKSAGLTFTETAGAVGQAGKIAPTADSALKTSKLFDGADAPFGFEKLPHLDERSKQAISEMKERVDVLNSGKISNVQRIDSVHQHVYTADVSTAGGDKVRAVVHFPSVSHEDFANRMRAEGAAEHLSPLLFNTVEPGVSRYVRVDGLSQRAIVHHHVGDDLLEAMGHRGANGIVSGVASDELGPALAKLYDRSAQSRKSLEETLVERSILGDTDLHEGNLRAIMKNRELSKLPNIDLEVALELPKLPAWQHDPSAFYHGFAGRPLLPSTVERVAQFVKNVDTPEARAVMSGLKVTEPEADAILARAHWFVTNQKLPPVLPVGQFYARYNTARGGGRNIQRQLGVDF